MNKIDSSTHDFAYSRIYTLYSYDFLFILAAMPRRLTGYQTKYMIPTIEKSTFIKLIIG